MINRANYSPGDFLSNFIVRDVSIARVTLLHPRHAIFSYLIQLIQQDISRINILTNAFPIKINSTNICHHYSDSDQRFSSSSTPRSASESYPRAPLKLRPSSGTLIIHGSTNPAKIYIYIYS